MSDNIYAHDTRSRDVIFSPPAMATCSSESLRLRTTNTTDRPDDEAEPGGVIRTRSP